MIQELFSRFLFNILSLKPKVTKLPFKLTIDYTPLLDQYFCLVEGNVLPIAYGDTPEELFKEVFEYLSDKLIKITSESLLKES